MNSDVQDPPEETPSEQDKIDNPPTVSEPPPLEEGREKKDVKLKYRKVQIKKLLSHIERQEGGQGITSLENIDELIQSALGSSRKILPHEFKFFSFLFGIVEIFLSPCKLYFDCLKSLFFFIDVGQRLH